MTKLKTPTLFCALTLVASLLCIPQAQSRTRKSARLLQVPAAPGALMYWTAGPSIPARSSAAAVVLANGRIVVLGGAATNPFEVLSLLPNAQAWTDAPALQNPRFAPGASASDTAPGRINVTGGRGSNNRAMKEVISYDPVTGNAQGLSSMNAARYLHGQAANLGGIYVIGGRDDVGLLSSVEHFTSKWINLAPLPEARSSFPAVYNGAHVFTFGGITAGAAATTTVNRYTPGSNTWDTVAPMPVATQNSAAVLGANGLIYVIGGSNGSVPLDTVQIYDIANDTWTLGTQLPTAVSSASAVIDANQQIVVIGGVDATHTNVSSVWMSPQAAAAPVITSSANTLATVGQPYSYVVAASGNPAPSFALISGPVGMVMNGSAITWTPTLDQIGMQPVTIRATNSAGNADQSFTIATAPPALTGLKVTDLTANSVTVSWDPLPPQSAPVDYYLSECSFSRNGCSLSVIAGPLATTSQTITGLVSGSNHTYSVKAVVNGVSSPPSTRVAFTTLQPAAPANFAVAGVTQNTVTLSWTAPANSAVPITAYRIYTLDPGLVIAIDNITGTTATVTGLLANSNHLFYVASLDANLNQSLLNGPLVVTTSSVPVLFHNATAFPRSVFSGGGFYSESLVAVIGDRLMLVSPDAHAAAGVNYVIGAVGLPAPTFSLVDAPTGMTIDPTTGVVTWNPVSGPAGTFTATARGTNSEGFGDFSFTYTVYPQGTDLLSPSAVQILNATATNITNTTATITWPVATDNVAVAGYNVYAITPALACFKITCPATPVVAPFVTTTGPGTSVTLTGLKPGSSYTFWIEAFDAAGNTSFNALGAFRNFNTLP